MICHDSDCRILRPATLQQIDAECRAGIHIGHPDDAHRNPFSRLLIHHMMILMKLQHGLFYTMEIFFLQLCLISAGGNIPTGHDKSFPFSRFLLQLFYSGMNETIMGFGKPVIGSSPGLHLCLKFITPNQGAYFLSVKKAFRQDNPVR